MKVLFGPYGSILPSLGLSPDVHQIVQKGEQDGYATAIEMIARGYVFAGATMPTVNAFFLRSALKDGFIELFKDMLSLNIRALLKALAFKKTDKITLCLGPASDCYQPQAAPDVKRSFAFHHHQYSLCLEVLNKFGLAPHDVIFLHETIGTEREALGIAQAAQSLSLPLIISFVVSKQGTLLSGESVESTIQSIDSQTSHFVKGFALNCCSPYAFDSVIRLMTNPTRIIGFYPNSYDADPHSYESGATLFEPKKEEILKLILEKGKTHHLQFIGGCCGFGYHDIKQLCSLLDTR